MNAGRLFLSFVIASYLFYPFFIGTDYRPVQHICAPVVVPFFLFVFLPLMIGNSELPVVGLSGTIACFLGLTAVLYALLWYVVEGRNRSA